MASILVISLCTEPRVGSASLLRLCVRLRDHEGEKWRGGVEGRGWREKRVLVGRRKAWVRGRQRLFKVCATPRGSFYYSLGRWSNSWSLECRLKRFKGKRERERVIFAGKGRFGVRALRALFTRFVNQGIRSLSVFF